jgi:AAA+ superfamily predicted ATPase
MKLDDLPFMEEIRDSFNAQQSNQFLLTGNVLDVMRCPWTSRDTSPDEQYIPLQNYLTERLGLKQRLVIVYNIAEGISFQSDYDRELALRYYLALFEPEQQKTGRDSFHEVISRSPAYILPSLVLLRKLCAGAAKCGAKVAIVLEHFDAVLPDRPLAQMSDLDRQRLIFFKEWLTDTSFLASSHLLLLIAETASAINVVIRGLPYLRRINLPLPDQEERKRFLRRCLAQHKGLKLDGSQQSFSELAAGMTLTGIEQIVRMAGYRGGKVTRAAFLEQLNRLLVSRIGDHIEIVHPGHSLKDVIGNTALKGQLDRVARTLKTGRADIAPVGMLVSGPNGVGKTYVLMAWAHACERVVLILKNLRSSHFGETDQIFEKIRNVLEVLGNVIIIVDEADTVFAKPGKDTHDTEQRLFGNVIKMMGDTKNRSRIVWVLMTARPDNLAPDLKRSGRCGLHLPIFDPEGDDRQAFIDFVLSQCGLKKSLFTRAERADFLSRTASFSPADFRELIVELQAEHALSKEAMSPTVVMRVLDDFLPSEIAIQRRLQTLQALLHCSRQSLVPDSLKELDRGDVYREIESLQQQLSY